MKALQDKIILVTGASSGIGKATALVCATQGARVILSARREDKLQEVSSQIRDHGGSGRCIPADLADDRSIDNLFNVIKAEYGRLDGAVNNAAAHPPAMELPDTPMTAFDQCIHANVHGTFNFLRQELLMMRAQRSGAVVNVSSVAGVEGILHSSAYTASKHAIVGMTRNAALDMAPYGIRVNCVCPGSTRTEMFDTWAAAGGPERLEIMLKSNPMRRAADPAELAQTIVFLLSQASSFVTGHIMMVDGGTTAGIAAS